MASIPSDNIEKLLQDREDKIRMFEEKMKLMEELYELKITHQHLKDKYDFLVGQISVIISGNKSV